MPALTNEQWEEMKSEFIRSGISYRKLAAKYDITVSAISKRAGREKWTKLRERYVDKLETELINKSAKSRAAQMSRLMRVTNRALEQTISMLEDEDQFRRYIVSEGMGLGVSVTKEKKFKKVDTKALRDLTAVIKDLDGLMRDYYDAPTPGAAFDRKMQKAKHKLDLMKAEREAADSDEAKVVEIVVEPRQKEDME